MKDVIGDDEAQNESYFISFSDLLVGILFLFIIILLAYGLNFRAAEEQTQRELSELQSERDQLERERDQIQAEKDALKEQTAKIESIARELLQREEWRDELLRSLAAQLADRGIEVAIDLPKGVLRLPESLLFASGSAELTEKGQSALSELARIMTLVVPCYVEASAAPCGGTRKPVLETVLVEGHTDDVPIRGGDYRDNWELAAARSVNTFSALVAGSPRLDDMSNERGEAVLGVSGYEARRPVASNDTAGERERNRRIDLRFLISAPKSENLADFEVRGEN